ncbi:hypothetical protein LguiB_012930 [Lonicera macranthoides]
MSGFATSYIRVLLLVFTPPPLPIFMHLELFVHKVHLELICLSSCERVGVAREGVLENMIYIVSPIPNSYS